MPALPSRPRIAPGCRNQFSEPRRDGTALDLYKASMRMGRDNLQNRNRVALSSILWKYYVFHLFIVSQVFIKRSVNMLLHTPTNRPKGGHKMRNFMTAKILAGICVLLMIGCATPMAMPYKNAQQEPVKAPKSVYLLTIKVENDYHTGHQPNLIVVNIEKKDAVDKSGRLNFLMDKIGTVASPDSEKGSSYFVRFELEPGDYIIRGFTSSYNSVFVHGVCFAPLHADLSAKVSATYYLGHIDATIREAKEKEFTAGGPVPLIDQAVCGFSGGTFDVAVSDNATKDIPLFKSKFVQLKDIEITPAVLGPFDRNRAQKFWDEH